MNVWFQQDHTFINIDFSFKVRKVDADINPSHTTLPQMALA